MNTLIVNCITNWTDDKEDITFIGFDEIFDQFQKKVNKHFANFCLVGGVNKVYIQFQYDCASLPNMVKGIKISRYSKKHKDIQAYIEITYEKYNKTKTNDEKLSLLKESLLNVVRELSKKLRGKVDNNIDDLIQMAETL